LAILIILEVIDNVNNTLKDDMLVTLRSGSKVAIAASCFSIYAFQELKEQLSDISELRFIFTSPSFVTEKADKQKREFYIPRLNRERDLYGSEFEIKLRNELSLKAVAKECAEWIRKKVCFKSNRTNAGMPSFVTIDIGQFSVEQENSLTEQIKVDEERDRLLRQIAALERQMNATKQPRRKRELFLELQNLKGALL
jgi:helicase/SNF2 domain-containing protein